MRRFMFDLSCEHKLSTDMGLLVPVNAEEVLAGDTFIGSATALCRVAPLAQPVMHRCEVRLHHWYVPNRILWDGWEGFITGRDDTSVPTITLPADSGLRALADHMGIYPHVGAEVNCLPFRAYNLIYNEFYRDQDLQTARTTDQLGLARCCWQKDYLTVARPSPQQGEPNSIPVSLGQAPVSTRDVTGISGTVDLQINASDGKAYADQTVLAKGLWAKFEDGESAAGISIDDMRRSLAFQRFAEARARFGERYVDYLRFLGVNPTDGRLDRPEYLGGGKQIISFSEVISTAETDSAGVGDLYGHGIAALRSRRYRKFFEEHGWVLTLLSVRPKTVYQTHNPRKFFRKDNMDYWQKELEVLPWQEVKVGEVYGAEPDNLNVFGYVPRYEEYRHAMSFVSGTLRGGTENDWTLSREFASAPTLNSSFVECTPSDRIYQDTNMPELIVAVKNRILAKRPVRGAASIGKIQ